DGLRRSDARQRQRRDAGGRPRRGPRASRTRSRAVGDLHRQPPAGRADARGALRARRRTGARLLRVARRGEAASRLLRCPRRREGQAMTAGRLKVAVIADYLEEAWPSMDLVADMLVDHLRRDHAGAVDVVLIRPTMPPRSRRPPSPTAPGRPPTLAPP